MALTNRAVGVALPNQAQLAQQRQQQLAQQQAAQQRVDQQAAQQRAAQQATKLAQQRATQQAAQAQAAKLAQQRAAQQQVMVQRVQQQLKPQPQPAPAPVQQPAPNPFQKQLDTIGVATPAPNPFQGYQQPGPAPGIIFGPSYQGPPMSSSVVQWKQNPTTGAWESYNPQEKTMFGPVESPIGMPPAAGTSGAIGMTPQQVAAMLAAQGQIMGPNGQPQPMSTAPLTPVAPTPMVR